MAWVLDLVKAIVPLVHFAIKWVIKALQQTAKTLVGLIGIVIITSLLLIVLDSQSSSNIPLSFLDAFVSDNILDSLRRLIMVEKALVGILVQWLKA